MVRCEPVDGMGMDWLDNLWPGKAVLKRRFPWLPDSALVSPAALASLIDTFFWCDAACIFKASVCFSNMNQNRLPNGP